MVEAAARHIQTTGRPCVVVRCTAAAGSIGAVTKVNNLTTAGTSTVTVDGAETPVDDFEVYVKCTLGGTIGTGPITIQTSLDGGRTLSAPISLGTAATYTFPDSVGVKLNFAAGTFVAGDVITCLAVAPAPSTANITSALTALQQTQAAWSLCEFATPIGTADFDVIETAFAAMFTAKKFKAWIGNIRMPTLAESESAYLAAQSGFAAKSTKCGELCAGSCELPSAVSGRLYRRPISFHVASKEASVAEHIDIADVLLGAAVGVSITDANGNPKHHDESVNPGLDDARFTTFRTWEGRSGVYVNRPRIFSSAGSDYDIMPKRRVMNLARATTRTYLEERLNKPVQVNETTGFILEEEALEIESGGRARLAAVLGPAPKASGWQMVLARTDNLISTKTLTVTTRVIPLAYPEFIEESIGFLNPALQTVAA
jgi:hypothetical protein